MKYTVMPTVDRADREAIGLGSVPFLAFVGLVARRGGLASASVPYDEL